MSMDDIRSLLPEAPLGHMLRLRQIFRDTPQLVHAPPASRMQRFGAKFISNWACDGQAKENQVVLSDVILVTGSLLLSISASLLFSMPSGCSDGDPCVALRQVDAILWTVSTWAFAVSVVTALLGVLYLMPSRSQDWPAQMRKHYIFNLIPMGCWVFGRRCAEVSSCAC